jgi:hypothetical protein
MAYQVLVDPKSRVGYVWLSGHVTSEDVMHAGVHLYDDPNWAPGFHELWDGLEIRELVLDWDTLREMVLIEEEARTMMGFGKIAMLFRRDLDIAMGKTLQALMSGTGRESHIILDPGKAQGWLEIDRMPEHSAA